METIYTPSVMINWHDDEHIINDNFTNAGQYGRMYFEYGRADSPRQKQGSVVDFYYYSQEKYPFDFQLGKQLAIDMGSYPIQPEEAEEYKNFETMLLKHENKFNREARRCYTNTHKVIIDFKAFLDDVINNCCEIYNLGTPSDFSNYITGDSRSLEGYRSIMNVSDPKMLQYYLTSGSYYINIYQAFKSSFGGYTNADMTEEYINQLLNQGIEISKLYYDKVIFCTKDKPSIQSMIDKHSVSVQVGYEAGSWTPQMFEDNYLKASKIIADFTFELAYKLKAKFHSPIPLEQINIVTGNDMFTKNESANLSFVSASIENFKSNIKIMFNNYDLAGKTVSHTFYDLTKPETMNGFINYADTKALYRMFFKTVPYYKLNILDYADKTGNYMCVYEKLEKELINYGLRLTIDRINLTFNIKKSDVGMPYMSVTDSMVEVAKAKLKNDIAILKSTADNYDLSAFTDKSEAGIISHIDYYFSSGEYKYLSLEQVFNHFYNASNVGVYKYSSSKEILNKYILPIIGIVASAVALVPVVGNLITSPVLSVISIEKETYANNSNANLLRQTNAETSALNIGTLKTADLSAEIKYEEEKAKAGNIIGIGLTLTAILSALYFQGE